MKGLCPFWCTRLDICFCFTNEYNCKLSTLLRNIVIFCLEYEKLSHRQQSYLNKIKINSLLTY